MTIIEKVIQKVNEIEKQQKILFPVFVKKALVKYFKQNNNKQAYINTCTLMSKIKDLPLATKQYLISNSVIEVIVVNFQNKVLSYRINNMPENWVTYEQYKIKMDKSTKEIIDKTFKSGMSIFD